MVVLDKIYSDLLKGYKFVQKNRIQREKKIKGKEKLELNIGSSNRYFPEIIKKYIVSNIKSVVQYNTIINGREIELRFYNFSVNTKILLLDRYAKYVFIIIYVLGLYSSKKCSKYISIDIYLTPFKKIKPSNDADQLDVINVNSGFSNFGCINSSHIGIYREEEWFKVLIHELFHNLNLDFSIMNIDKWKQKLFDICGINSEYKIFETYCETWARILNVAFVSFLQNMNKQNSKQGFKKIFNELIKKEQKHSLNQAAKIQQNIEIHRFTMERSNVFCYYILTAILISNYKKFMNWCNTNNVNLLKFKSTDKNISSFIDLILENSDSLPNMGRYIDNEDSLRMSKISI